MNKQEFLEKLSKRIHMLEDSEQKDILTEYAQHIDLRMHGGLSEEDAIKDFGDFDQLVSEILGAYHVKADLQDTPASTTTSSRPFTEYCQTTCSSIGRKLKAAGAAVKHFFACIAHKMQNGFRHVTHKIKGLFHRKSADAAPHTPRAKADRSPWFTSLGSALHRIWNWLGRTCLLLLRLAWNLGLLLCALPIVLAMLIMFLCLGTSLILLFQGYSFLGVILCTLGGLLSCFGLLGLGQTIIWHRPRKENTFYEEAE